MTQYTIPTNDKEAEAILKGDKRFIIRNHRDVMHQGDMITFQLYRNMKRIYHQVNNLRYVVTRVDDYRTAPITKGCKLISFKEMP